MIKSKERGCAAYIAHRGETRNAYKIFVGNLTGREHLGDSGIDGRILLKWILSQ
jgi:hypothetical protein